MNKVFKLIWNTSQNAWVVCSELGKRGKTKTQKTVGGIPQIIMVLAASGGVTMTFATECAVNTNGTISVNNIDNNAGCELSSVGPVLNLGQWGILLNVYSGGGADRVVTITNDLTTTINGGIGFSAYSEATVKSYIDGRGKTINLTTNQNPGMSQGGGWCISRLAN